MVAAAVEVVEIAEAEAPGDEDAFTAAERAYAQAKRDPARRLAARLAAKRAALRLLGPGLTAKDVEVVPSRGGPPGLWLSPAARARMRELGAGRALVSLTHERRHAAASVLLLRGQAG